ncbi:MAG: hypothetical protein AB7F32_08065 [Victivallaceae bacterium]
MWQELIEKMVAGSVLTAEELESLRTGCRVMEEERDAVRRELGELQFRNKVGELAEKHRFTDAEYLAFLCRQRNLEPGMERELDGFMAELREQSPRLFRVDVKPGIGPVGGVVMDTEPPSVADLLANAPELK